jgi:hypothetical protein
MNLAEKEGVTRKTIEAPGQCRRIERWVRFKTKWRRAMGRDGNQKLLKIILNIVS